MRSYARLLGASEQRREHFLQSGDEVVGFPIALQHGFDGLVLDADLYFEKFVLAFEPLDIGCRDRTSARKILEWAFGFLWGWV